MKYGVLVLAVCTALGSVVPAAAQGDNKARVEVLYEGVGGAVICNARSAIVKGPDFTDERLSKPDAEIERLAIEHAIAPVRQKARIYQGMVNCADDYVWSIYDVPNVPHSYLFMFRWPPQDATPAFLGGASDVDAAGPGLVFVPHYASETVQQTRERIPGSTFLLLPQSPRVYPTSAVRIGTSSTGLPLIFAIHGSGFHRTLGALIIEAGQDPVLWGGAVLNIEGVMHRLQAASVSLLGSHPLVKFAYRTPEYDDKAYIVGAAVCQSPRDISADIIDCRPLVQIRLPFGLNGPPSGSGAGLDEPTRIDVPKDGTRAFVATTASDKTCITTYALGGPGIKNVAAACALEVAGKLLQLVAVSDSELLVLTWADRNTPPVRLFRVSGL